MTLYSVLVVLNFMFQATARLIMGSLGGILSKAGEALKLLIVSKSSRWGVLQSQCMFLSNFCDNLSRSIISESPCRVIHSTILF